MNRQVGNVQLMQKLNRVRVLNYIRSRDMACRPEIAEETGLSLSSVTNIVSYLKEMNLLVGTGVEDVQRVGRKADILKFNGANYNFVCVNIDLNSIYTVYVDLEGKIIDSNEQIIKSTDYKMVLNIVSESIKKIMNNNGSESVLCVGISMSGLVLENSILSSNLRWKLTNIKDDLENAINKPVVIENVSITKAVWQLKGNEKINHNNVLFVDLEEGIGAVQFYNGLINKAVIGEIGHTTVEKDGVLCFCGNKGCLEAMCSIDRVVSLSSKFLGENCDYNEVISACQNGNRKIKEILLECSEYLGIGLANLINIFNPQKLIINGGKYFECDYIYENTVKVLKKRMFSLLSDNIIIDKVIIKKTQIAKGMALYLCDYIFDIENKLNIIQ